MPMTDPIISYDLPFLKLFVLSNVLGLLVIGLIPDKWTLVIKQLSLVLTFKLFLISTIAYVLKPNAPTTIGTFSVYGHQVAYACDSISLLLILLTSFIIFIAIVISLDLPDFKYLALCFILMELLLLFVWVVMDVFLFYIFFESVLIPMFLIIQIWGSRARKVRAAYLLFMYTVIGSLPMLISLIYIQWKVGTTNLYALQNIEVFTFTEQRWLWLGFFLAFAVKVPMFPVHLWLPEAHVEAPTAGSLVLAGVLLKLGSYAMLRFLNPLFPIAALYFTPMVHTLALLGVIFGSLTALRQNDLKRVIAYASIAHMNLIILGIFSPSVYAIEGAVFQMISHGLVASLLFLMVGVLYDRSGTRLISNYSGLALIMPTFSTYFLLATIANMGFPGTCNFIGEALLFSGIFLVNPNSGYLAAIGIFLCATYSIWLYNRVFFGNLGPAVSLHGDLDYLEKITIEKFLIPIFVLGFFCYQPNS